MFPTALRYDSDSSTLQVGLPVQESLAADGELVERGLHRIHDEDKPAHILPSTTRLLARCETAGPHIGALCQRMYSKDGLLAIRRIQGVNALARKHGAALADDGCAAAWRAASKAAQDGSYVAVPPSSCHIHGRLRVK